MKKISLAFILGLSIIPLLGHANEKEDSLNCIEICPLYIKNLISPEKEIDSIKMGITLYNSDIQKLKLQFEDQKVFNQKWENFLKSYEEVSITNELNLEQSIKDYRKTHQKVTNNSSPEELLSAFKQATEFHYKLEGSESRADSNMALIIKICVENVFNFHLKEWMQNLSTDYKDGKITKEKILVEVETMEEACEKTISRLIEKKKLLNELRSKRLFIQQLSLQS